MGHPVQFTVGVIMIGGGLAATVMRNRLAAVLMVGVSGYGLGVLFALQARPTWR